MQVEMYVYRYACMHVRRYVCMYVCRYVCIRSQGPCKDRMGGKGGQTGGKYTPRANTSKRSLTRTKHGAGTCKAVRCSQSTVPRDGAKEPSLVP